MKTSVEPLEGNKVKVYVEVDEQELDAAIDKAFKKLAHEVNIPGFRRGKVPRRVLEARIGSEVGRSEALRESVPEYYMSAVRENEVDVIAPPEIEITDGEEEGPVCFEAVVEIRPTVTVPGYGSLRVAIDNPEPTDEEIDAQLDRLRNQFGELEVVERPAEDGDFVTIDVQGFQDGEPLDQLTAEDYSYEVGSGGILPEVDDQLRGAGAGETLEFDAAMPGATPPAAEVEDDDDDDDDDDEDGDETPNLQFVITVKEVKHKVLPELDDAFANDASEFETLAELRENLRDRSRNVKKVQAQMALREKTGEALSELVEEEVPDALVNQEVSNRLNDLASRLSAQGLDLDTWVAMSGRPPEDIVEELRETATQAVKVDLALRAVVEAEGIECTDEDLEAEYAQLAARMNLKAKDVRKQFERAEQVPAVRSDIKNRKAFDLLLERVEIVDNDGKTIERSVFELESAEDDSVDSDTDEDTDVTDQVADGDDEKNEADE